MAKKITTAQSAVLNTLTQVANGQLDADEAIAKIDRITEAAQVTQADADAVATDPTVAKALKARKSKTKTEAPAQVETKTVVTATGKRKKVKAEAPAQVNAPALVEGSLTPPPPAKPVKVKAKWTKDQMVDEIVAWAFKTRDGFVGWDFDNVISAQGIIDVQGANLEQRGMDLDKVTAEVVKAADAIIDNRKAALVALTDRMTEWLLAKHDETGSTTMFPSCPNPADDAEFFAFLGDLAGTIQSEHHWIKNVSGDYLRSIQTAIKGYRKTHPMKKRSLVEEAVEEAVAAGESPAKSPKVKAASSKKSSEGGGRSTILGHAMTAVIRWMGNDGWDFATARAVLDQLKAPAADNTVRWQLRAGRKEELPLADLSAAQQNELRGMRPTADDKPAKAEKSKKSAPKSEEVAEAPAKKSAKADAPKSTAKATAKGGKKKVAKKSKSN